MTYVKSWDYFTSILQHNFHRFGGHGNISQLMRNVYLSMGMLIFGVITLVKSTNIIRIFKLVHYTSNYYFKFSPYVANDEQPNSEYGKTHDLVVRIVHEDLGKSYIISIDNFYLFPYLQS